MAGVIVRERDIRGFSSGGREGFPEEVAALLELTTNHDCRTPLSLMETKFSSVRLSGSLFPYPSSLHYGCPPPRPQRHITGQHRITRRELSLMLLCVGVSPETSAP